MLGKHGFIMGSYSDELAPNPYLRGSFITLTPRPTARPRVPRSQREREIVFVGGGALWDAPTAIFRRRVRGCNSCRPVGAFFIYWGIRVPGRCPGLTEVAPVGQGHASNRPSPGG